MPEETQQENKQESAIAVAPRYAMREMLTILKDTGDPALFQSFAREIVEREVASALFDQDGRLARVFAMSGEFDGLKNKSPEQAIATAMTKIQLGRSWNMVPADSMKSIDFINGKPFIESDYLASKMRDAGLDWDLEWSEDAEGLCTGCTLWMKRLTTEGKYAPIMARINGQEQQAKVAFTKAHADRAKISEGGKWIPLSQKFNYQSWAEDMYYARAISRARKRYAPNVLSGILTRDEAEDITPGDNAGQVKSLPERAQLTAASFTPSTEQNRGHDAVSETQPKRTRKPREEKPEPKPVETKTEAKSEAQPDPTATIALPWRNKADMDNVLRVQQFRVGPKAYSDALAGLNATTGDLQWTGGVSVQLYLALKALPDEEDAKPQPVTANAAAQGKLDDDGF